MGIRLTLGLLLLLLGSACNEEPVEVKVDVEGTGLGNGTVTWNGSTGFSLIACTIHAGQQDGDCFETAQYASGAHSATIFAVPADDGTWFESWTGCDAVSGTACEISWDEEPGSEISRHLKANFGRDPLISVRIRVAMTGNGEGDIKTRDVLPGEELNCSWREDPDTGENHQSGKCDITFDDADGEGQITLEKTTLYTTQLTAWTGCTEVTAGGDCVLKYASAGDLEIAVSARLEAPIITATTTISGAGTGIGRVAGDFHGEEIDCLITTGITSGTCAMSLTDEGPAVFAMVATPEPGSAFAEWTGCPQPDGDRCTLRYDGTANTAFAITARFDLAAPPLLGPDEFIVFSNDPDGESNPQRNRIVVVSRNSATQLTSGLSDDLEPAWSPDGSRIVFRSKRIDPLGDIWVMNADGTGQARLSGDNTYDHDPDWSSTNRVVYVSDRYINDELFWIDVNAPATTVRLTHSPEDELEPKYSPNGSRIAFVVEEVSYYGSPGIHVMNADGTGAIQLTGSSSDDDPAWSPDGTKIAFTRNHRLWIMNADGSGQTELINENAFDDASPAFSPDGTKLAFVRGGSNIRKIYVLNFADSSVKQLPLVPFGNQDDLDWIRRP